MSGMASINLPFLWGPQGEMARMKTAELEEAKLQVTEAENDLEYDLAETMAMVERLQKTVSRYQDVILPQARQALESAEANYQVNKIDFLTLLDNQKTLFQYEVEVLEVVTMYHHRMADLETLVGTQLAHQQEGTP